MKYIFKNFYQKMIRQVRKIKNPSTEMQMEMETVFQNTINNMYRFAETYEEKCRFSLVQVKQNLAMPGHFMYEHSPYRQLSKQITPIKSKSQSYFIMMGGVLV